MKHIITYINICTCTMMYYDVLWCTMMYYDVLYYWTRFLQHLCNPGLQVPSQQVAVAQALIRPQSRSTNSLPQKLGDAWCFWQCVRGIMMIDGWILWYPIFRPRSISWMSMNIYCTSYVPLELGWTAWQQPSATNLVQYGPISWVFAVINHYQPGNSAFSVQFKGPIPILRKIFCPSCSLKSGSRAMALMWHLRFESWDVWGQNLE